MRPTPSKKRVTEQAAAVVAAGGEVWFGDRRWRRRCANAPRCALGWARRGEPRVIVISGRTARRVLHGALNVATGEFVPLLRERSRQDDGAAFRETLGQVRPQVPKVLVSRQRPTPPSQAGAGRGHRRPDPARLPALPRARADAVRRSLALGQRGGSSQPRVRNRSGAGRASRGVAR